MLCMFVAMMIVHGGDRGSGTSDVIPVREARMQTPLGQKQERSCKGRKFSVILTATVRLTSRVAPKESYRSVLSRKEQLWTQDVTYTRRTRKAHTRPTR